MMIGNAVIRAANLLLPVGFPLRFRETIRVSNKPSGTPRIFTNGEMRCHVAIPRSIAASGRVSSIAASVHSKRRTVMRA